MRFCRSDASDEPHIELIPLIDVVLVLIIFFVITTTFNIHSSMQLDLPKASAQPTAQTSSGVVILINASGHYFVNDREVLRTDADTLKRSIAQVAGQDRTQPVVLRADARTPYQAVITAQDMVSQLGFKRITIATALAAQSDDE